MLKNKITWFKTVNLFHHNPLVGEVYDQKGFIKANPFFIIEVVSNKNSLQQDLRKMAQVWIPAGTQVGLVVCPYRKEYYLFDKQNEKYTAFNFSKKFTHDKLSHLEIDFAQLLKEAEESLK